MGCKGWLQADDLTCSLVRAGPAYARDADGCFLVYCPAWVTWDKVRQESAFVEPVHVADYWSKGSARWI